MINLIQLDDGCIEIVLHPEHAQDLQSDYDENGPESAIYNILKQFEDNGYSVLNEDSDEESDPFGPPIIGTDLTLDVDGYVQLTPTTRAWFYSGENEEKNFVEELLENGYITLIPLNFNELEPDYGDEDEPDVDDGTQNESTNFHRIKLTRKNKNRCLG